MQEKRERLLARTREESPRRMSSPKSTPASMPNHAGLADSSSPGRRRRLRPDELPDGSCFSPQRVVPNANNDTTATKHAKFIGAFSVCGEDQNSRAEFVRKELAKLHKAEKNIPVLLVISITGIKVYNSDGQSVRMAHALKRISYATCDPEQCQFSYLAREPCGRSNLQYCHAFLTDTPRQAEELNTIVGNAFKMAYADQHQKQPSFLELIAQQVEEQKAKFQEIENQTQQELPKRLTQNSQPTVQQRMEERRQSERPEREFQKARLPGKDRTLWAKPLAGLENQRATLGRDSTVSPPHNLRQNYTPSTPPNLRQNHTPSPPPNLRQNNTPSPPPNLRHNHTPSIPPSSTHATIMALREVLNAQEPLLNRSPVTAMKDTIDNHFNNANHRWSDQMRSDTDYLQPVSMEHNHDIQHGTSSRHLYLSNRPLPSPPCEEKNVRQPNGHGSPSTRVRNSKAKYSPETVHNNHSPDSNSPCSQDSRYQNGSPVHYRSNSGHSDGADSGVDGMYQGPPLPVRYDSLKKIDASYQLDGDEHICQSPWYQAGIPREIALELLQQEEIGSFIVRDSTTHPNCYALSVRVPKFDNPTGISHYLIMRTSKGVKLKGLDKEWPSLSAMVTHHTVMREMLPCTLTLPRNSNNPAFHDVDRDEKDEDEDYQKLSDFSSMMADLKMK